MINPKVFFKLIRPNKYPAGRRIDNIRVGKMVRITPGGRHAYFESGDTLVRKPI